MIECPICLGPKGADEPECASCRAPVEPRTSVSLEEAFGITIELFKECRKELDRVTVESQELELDLCATRTELDRYKRAMAVARERIERHWSGNSEDVCMEIATILQENKR